MPDHSGRHVVVTGAGRAFTAVSDLGNRLVGMPVERGVLPLLFATTCDVPGNSYLGPHRPFQLHGWPVQVGRSALASNPSSPRRSGMLRRS